MAEISQSSIIAGALVLAFVATITSKGELPTYLAFFGVGTGPKNAGGSGIGSGIGSVGGNMGGFGGSDITGTAGNVTGLATGLAGQTASYVTDLAGSAIGTFTNGGDVFSAGF